MKLTKLETLAEAKTTAPAPKRTRNFNDMMRQAKKIKMDLRGGDENLDPTIEITLKNGDVVFITANPNGKSIGWGYEDEAMYESVGAARGQGLCEETSVDPIVKKIADTYGISFRVAHAIFVGGSAQGMQNASDKLDKLGYDTAGTTYMDNAEFFKKAGVTKAEFNRLVKASM